MCAVRVAPLGKFGIGAEIKVPIRQPQAALAQHQYVAAALLVVGGHLNAPESGLDTFAMPPRDRCRELIASADPGRPRKLSAQRSDSGALDRHFVHARRVEVGNLAQRRLGAQRAVVLRKLERGLELTRIALGDFLESAPPRPIGGNRGAIEPVAVHVSIEVRARPDVGVQVRDVERSARLVRGNCGEKD